MPRKPGSEWTSGSKLNQNTSIYLIVVNDVPTTSGIVPSREIIDFLLARRVWIFPAYAGHLRNFRPRDRLLVYQAGKGARQFVATAQVTSPATPLTGDLKADTERFGLSWFNWLVNISNIRMLHPLRPIHPLVQRLEFITDKKNYGLSLRQGVRRISDKDFSLIVAADSERLARKIL